MRNRYHIFIFLIFTLLTFSANAQIIISPIYVGDDPEALLLAQNLAGAGITVSDANYVGTCTGNTGGTGGSGATTGNRGYFYNGNIGITNGIVLSSGNIAELPDNNSTSNTRDWNLGGESDLTATLGGQTYDAIGFEFTFIPDGNTASFRYVWGSDEYDEYVGSAFNDGFAFYITSLDADGYNYSKKNIALIPGTATPVSINNVNKTSYAQYFNGHEFSDGDNTPPIECDGYTTVLTAVVATKPCARYRMKLVLGDVGDRVYDSWVFFETNSLTSPVVQSFDATYSPVAAGPYAVEGCNTGTVRINLTAPAGVGGRRIPFSLSGTATEPRLASPDYALTPNLNATYNTIYANKYYATVLEGWSYVDLSVTALQDWIAEPDETIIVTVDLLLCPPTTSITKTLTLKDNNTPLSVSVINADPDFACISGGVTMTASGAGGWLNSGAYTYSWSPAAGLNFTNVANPIANPVATTVYTVTVTDKCNNTSTSTQTISPYHESGNYGQWYGNISVNWDECRNWGKGKIPDSNIDVVIPNSGVTNWPTKTGNITIGTDCNSITMQNATNLTITGNLTINDGKNLTCLNTANISIGGNWLEGSNGIFNKGASIVTFNGSGTQQVNNGLTRTYNFYNIVIDGPDVIFYYKGSVANNKVGANNITVNTGMKMSTVKQ